MQAKILSLSDAEGNKIKLTLLVTREGKSYRKTFTVSEDLYEKLGFPSLGATISESEYKSLLKNAKKGDAVNAAVNILSYGDNNCAALERKLRQKGFSREEAQAAVAKMLEKGYINEKDQVYRYVVTLANKKMFGPRKIYLYLTSKGYLKRDIEEAISKAQSEKEINFSKIKTSLILKFRPENEEEEKKLLYKYGFSVGDCE